MVDIGPRTELNVFEMHGDAAPTSSPRFDVRATARSTTWAAGRRPRRVRRDPPALVARGASDGFVTDFGRAHSVFFRDPDGLEGEVLLWISHDAEVHPPGTPAKGYDDL